MKQSKAEDVAMHKYGLLKGARLVTYASKIYVLGEEEFDRHASRAQRYLVLKELNDAGIRFDEIEWADYIENLHRFRIAAQARKAARARGPRPA